MKVTLISVDNISQCGSYYYFLVAFSLYDTEHKGVINVKQLMDILKSLGVVETDEQKIKLVVQKNDKNNSGSIDFDAFVNVMTEVISSSPVSTPREDQQSNQDKAGYFRSMSRHEADELKVCFEKFDKNGDGHISEEELKQVMSELGEKLTGEEIKDMINDADTNNDGQISFEEFKGLIPS